MNPLLKTALLRFIAFSLLTSLSAWLFVFVEYTGKNEVHEKYPSLRSLYESMAWKYNMSINEFNNFSNAVYEAMSVPAPVWTYHNAMDFVLQTVTTIGYGSVTPKTATGQVMCILVCLVGIPISMLSIKSVGEVFALWFMAIIQKFEKKVLKRQEPKGLETKSAVILFSLMILFVFGNGLILVSLKGWTLLEGVYFWFVTLTTIGFGDYLMREPAQRITHLEMNGSIAHDADGENESLGFKIVMSFFSLIYLVLSLCLVSSVLNSVIAALENHNFQPRCQRCIPHGTPNQTSLDRKREPAERDETNMASLNMENHGFQKENTTPLRKGSVLIQSTQLSDIN